SARRMKPASSSSLTAERSLARRPPGRLPSWARAGAPFLDQVLELAHELADVFERPVHRREAHVCHLVELVQLAHDCFTNHRARDFLLTAFLQRLLDAVGGLLDGRDADRPFLARLLQTGDDLETVEQLAAAVLLDHHRQHLFDALVRREASFAVEAL